MNDRGPEGMQLGKANSVAILSMLTDCKGGHLLSYGEAALVVEAIRNGEIPNLKFELDKPGTQYPRKGIMGNKKVLWMVHHDHLGSKFILVGNVDLGEFTHTVSIGTPRDFKMYDDDGELYYTGQMVCIDGSDPFESSDIFAPLDDYGRPNAGCTELRVLREGAWVTI